MSACTAGGPDAKVTGVDTSTADSGDSADSTETADSDAAPLDSDGDGTPDDEDCAPNDASISPTATEVCDHVDNNCDGTVDEGVSTTVYTDADGDGYGDDASETTGCAGEGVATGGDCDDTNAAVKPGAPEVCDGTDNDCDGSIDEGIFTETTYTDADGDGYGDDATAAESCDVPDGAVTTGGDCDDTDPDISPGAAEIPLDGIDQNCDGVDGGHNVFAVERYDGTVAELSGDDGSELATLTGFGGMIGIARADDGTLYISRYDDSKITAIAPDLGSSTDVVTSGLTGPHTLQWDPSTQTLLIGGYYTNTVFEFDPSTSALTELSTAVSVPIGVFRFPGDDVVYVTSRVAPDLFAISSATGEELARIPLPNDGDTISPDGPDALWVSSGNGGAVYHVDLTVPTVTTVATGIPYAYGNCVAPDGDALLVGASESGDAILAVTAAGATSTFSTALSSPWQCATDVAYDADGDGLWSAYYGGTDCDDTDASAGECPGGTRWPD